MSDINPRKLVDDLRARLKSNGDKPCQLPFEADRRHLLKMSDNRYTRQSVKTLDYVVVVDVVGFIEDHNEQILGFVSEKLKDTVDWIIPRELLVDVRWMLTERFAKDCPVTLTEASDMRVKDGGYFSSRSNVWRASTVFPTPLTR